ncbi:hypothetical protein D3C81_09390 [compost metagenome]
MSFRGRFDVYVFKVKERGKYMEGLEVKTTSINKEQERKHNKSKEAAKRKRKKKLNNRNNVTKALNSIKR